MRTKRIILLLLLGSMAYASDQPIAKRTGDSLTRPATNNFVRPAATSSVSHPVIAGVVAKNLTIGANACQDITVDADFSGAQQIALAIQSANGADLSATRIVTYFGVPGADWMAVGGEIKASDFPFYNGGGGMVPVFGPALLLQVCNDGASAVAFSQMTYYAVE